MIFMPVTIVNGKYEQKRGTCLRKIAECLHYICSMSSCNKIRQIMGTFRNVFKDAKLCCISTITHVVFHEVQKLRDSEYNVTGGL